MPAPPAAGDGWAIDMLREVRSGSNLLRTTRPALDAACQLAVADTIDPMGDPVDPAAHDVPRAVLPSS